MSSIYPQLEEDKKIEKSNPPVSSSAAKSSDVPEYNGEPGPQDGRSCKDIIFLILFAGVWVGMFVIAGLAIRDGNISRLKYGNDTEGNLCGVNNPGGRDHSGAKFQYLFDPTDPFSYRKCVSQCPNETYDIICPYDVVKPSLPAKNESDPFAEISYYFEMFNLLKEQNCTFTYASYPTLFRCIPSLAALNGTFNADNKTAIGKTMKMLQSSGNLGAEIFSDVYNSWQVILICSFIALGLSFLWLFAVQYVASLMVWSTILLVNMLGLGLCAYLWSLWAQGMQITNADELAAASATTSSYQNQMLLALSIIATVFGVGILILTIALRSRIRLAIALITETAKAVRAMPLIIFFPVVKYALLLGLTAWTIWIWVLLATSGETISAKVGNYANATISKQFSPNRIYDTLTIYYAFGYFWTYNFIIAVAQCSIAGSIATYYWTRDKNAMPSNPISKAFWRTCRYHLGSMAFGSLIIAIIQMIRWFLAYLQHKLKQNAANNQIIACLLTCLQCCFWCLENFFKFINKNSYIEIAIYGYNFCEASKVAFQLLVRNAVRVVVVDKVGDFLFFLGKLTIMFATTLIGAYMLQNPVGSDPENQLGRFWAVPLALIALISYVIAGAFMAVFDMAVQTIFLCFCEDSERNDGQGKPYYMEASLRAFVDNQQKIGAKV